MTAATRWISRKVSLPPLRQRLQEGEVEDHPREGQGDEGGGVEPVGRPFQRGVLGDPLDGNDFRFAPELDGHFTSSIRILRRTNRKAPRMPTRVAPKATLPSGWRIFCQIFASAGYCGLAGRP